MKIPKLILHYGLPIFFFLSALLIFLSILGFNEIIKIQPHNFGLNFDLLCLFLTITIIAFYIYYYKKFKRFDFFEFPVWFTLNIFLQVIINVWILQRDYFFYSPWLLSDPEYYANLSLILVWFSLIIIWIIYFLISKFSKNYHHYSNFRSNPRILLMLIVWIITWLINLYFTIIGAQGYLSSQSGFTGGNYLLFINLVNNLVTINLFIIFFKNPNKFRKIWIIFACVSRLLVGLILGTKGEVIIILFLIMSFYYSRNHIPKTLLVVGFTVVLFTVPVVTNFRSNLFYYGYTRASGASFIDRVNILSRSFIDAVKLPLSEMLNQTQNTLERRQSGIFEVTSAFLAVHPKYQSFLFSDMIESVSISIIPRFLWKEKPSLRPNIYNIGMNYLGAKQELSFAAVGQIADSYRTGGIVFLIIWLFFLSWISYFFYNLGPLIRNISGTSFYLVMITGIITYDNNVYSTIMRLMQFGIILFVLNSYVFFKKDNKRNYENPKNKFLNRFSN